MMPRLLTWSLLVALLVAGAWFVFVAEEHYLLLQSYGPMFTPTPQTRWRPAKLLAIGATLLACAAVVYATLLRKPRKTARGFDIADPADDPGRGEAA